MTAKKKAPVTAEAHKNLNTDSVPDLKDGSAAGGVFGSKAADKAADGANPQRGGGIATKRAKKIKPADMSMADLVRAVIDSPKSATVEELAGRIRASGEPLSAYPLDAVKRGVEAFREALSQKKLAPCEIDIDPWPDAVEAMAVLDEMRGFIRGCLHFPKAVADAQVNALAYYCLATWFAPYASCTGYLCLTAATKGCGKSAAIELCSELVRRPYMACASTSSATIMRGIDTYKRPTLLLDETDTWLKEDREAIGLLNTGIREKSALVPRNVPDAVKGWRVEFFRVFGPKIMAGINAARINDALVSRSIIIMMEPAKNQKALTKLMDIPEGELERLRRKAARLAEDYGPRLRTLTKENRPAFPDSFDGRRIDKWMTLFCLASFFGADELKRLTADAEMIEGAHKSAPDYSLELLADVRDVLRQIERSPQKTGMDVELPGQGRVRVSINPAFGGCILARDLNAALRANADLAWRGWRNRPDGLSVCEQSKILAGFGISSKMVKAAGNVKAYILQGADSLEAAFSTYLSPQAEAEGEEA